MFPIERRKYFLLNSRHLQKDMMNLKKTPIKNNFFESLCLFTILDLFTISVTPNLKLLLSIFSGCINFESEDI